MKLLTHLGYLTEEEGMTYMAETDDPDSAMTPLQSAACTYRIALVLRAGQKCVELTDMEVGTSSNAGAVAGAYMDVDGCRVRPDFKPTRRFSSDPEPAAPYGRRWLDTPKFVTFIGMESARRCKKRLSQSNDSYY